jgi:SAM-dependent methyltransferase
MIINGRDTGMSGASFYRNYYRDHAVRFDRTRLWREDEIGSTVRCISVHLTRGEKIGELGCGSFKHGALLSSAGFEVFGLDFSVDQLRYAPAGSQVICADVREMPIASGALGSAFAIMVLHQVPEDERALVLSEISRALRNGGTLIIKTCRHEDLRRRPLARWFPSSVAINLARFPADAELKRLLAQSGLRATHTWSTETYSLFQKDELLEILASRPSSSLRLVPADEYADGLARFHFDHPENSVVRMDHYHTYYLAHRE